MKSKKTHTDKKIILYQLTQLVEALYPNRKSTNPYFEQFNEQLQGLEIEEQLLYHKLLHCFTLLNKQTRMYENSHTVMTSKEDIINVFYFFTNDYQVNAQKLYEFYNDVEKVFKKKPFTKLEAQVKLRTNKRFVERCLSQLQIYGLVKCTQWQSGQKNQYQLLEKTLKPSQIENQDLFKEAFEEWEDFRGFEQF
ncbi:hypothetical protein C3B47_13845 [Flavobacterium columnare]|uniref:hypothetical protein n=1 Tax=Flavobacterium columnare TaxID=996 RepID=UPI000981269B|nr:hypothetical protein [Flavobacterium columnare]MBF6653942.1 hypothetical protein [Flavobacterium columnare]OOB82209.1 hypothetical protein BZL53_10340 [Flavobacterium columnare]OOB82214.1 hypothetical protein BZL53_10365 [Flavobacterium columnare]PTD14308.1 hypothetical protein C6N29_07595 [Flavobacterium columnare]